MKVRVRGSHNPVAEGNCVVVRRGGEQPEAKPWSVGNELDSAGNSGELLSVWRSLKFTECATVAVKATFGLSLWLKMEHGEVCVR